MTRDNAETMLAELDAQGFDASRITHPGGDAHYAHPASKLYRVTVRCSQCEALVISGMATHETGCPNKTRKCSECGASVPERQRLCEDCARDEFDDMHEMEPDADA